ncbi:hypothetical protein AM493_14170 [Flavobacterium akiainvivens]|uniref:Uncharacterized protein n=1 Tax=Flavobacterium akiainvivens TaxID=1202724 RepID=A0A0M9VIU9_9FLAO|nr:T9SS type A sorting domain-containing protein [Flavobacterium akiainvivens]KOS07050.1 hypothetical protein AM493_14170 [Flavobacterium akiainvivens]SFQ58748.1 delta-60 repeat domain-containing protein/Por secretion system C-terminal sorting domain-containing protein [Flavobacterium akiainvivens]
MKKFFTLSAFVCSLALSAQTLALDADFNQGGTGVTNGAVINDVFLLNGGKILIGGGSYFNSYNGIPVADFACLNQDGSLDESFNISLPGGVACIAGADDKIYVGGAFSNCNGNPVNQIIRLNSDGSLDSEFTSSVVFDSTPGLVKVIYSIAVDANGKILVGGDFKTPEGNRYTIIRLNADGSLDTTFAYNGDYNGVLTKADEIIVLADNKILVAGNMNDDSDTLYKGLIRLNENGTIDTTFNSKYYVRGVVHDVVLEYDGKIVAAGFFDVPTGNTVATLIRLNDDGSIDESFSVTTAQNSYSANRILDIEKYNGKYLVSGKFDAYGDHEVHDMALINYDGSIDTSFSIGAGVDFHLTKAVALNDGKILAAGSFMQFNGESKRGIVRLIGTVVGGNKFTEASSFVYKANDCFNIVSDNEIANVSIYDVSGKLIYTAQAESNNLALENTFSNGVFFVNVSYQNGSTSQHKILN